MAKKKAVQLSTLPFGDLKDKVKELEGIKTMNRFEITEAIMKAENRPCCLKNIENPRQVKPKIVEAKSRLDTATDKKERHALRKEIAGLKRKTRQYF